MKKITDLKFYYCLIFVIFLTGLLSACGKTEKEQAEEIVFGIDYSEELAIQSIVQVICGEEKAWAITAVKDDFVYQLSYETQKNGVEQIIWQPEDGDYYMINIAEQNDTLYAELWNKETEMIEIGKRGIDGKWSEVVSIRPEGDGWSIMGSGFYVDSSEDLYLVNGNTVVCFDGDGKQKCVYEFKGSICFFQENGEGTTECVVADEKSVALYQLGGNRAEKSWGLEISGEQVHTIRSSKEETLCLATNEELLFVDRKSGILLARTDLVKLGVTAPVAGYYNAEEGLLRLYCLEGSGAEGLHYYFLSGRDTAAEQRTELIYGMVGIANPDTASNIWTAITTFNQTNEDYYVTIRNYDGYFNLERLHTDMAVGKGPDIIDMTYSQYYESYVKNGYLVDLSPYLEQSQYKDDIIWNVLNAYEVDGGLYMLVPQFQLEEILIHPDYAESVGEWNMGTFLNLIEQNCWEKDLFMAWGNPETILYYLLCGRQQEFIDWEKGEAFFETKAFLEMLVLCGEYAAEEWPDIAEWTYEEQAWHTLCLHKKTGREFYYYLSNIDIYGREYKIYGYPTSVGQVYGISACADSCAIYSGSKNKEGAWEFIESLLWDSNQRYAGCVEPGFPIRSSILKELEEEAKETECIVNGEKIRIMESEIMIQEDIIYNGNLASILINPDIWAVVQEEAASYFAGDKTAAEVAHIIQSRVGIILGE